MKNEINILDLIFIPLGKFFGKRSSIKIVQLHHTNSEKIQNRLLVKFFGHGKTHGEVLCLNCKF